MSIKIPVCELEISDDLRTIWVHSPCGATVLRFKSFAPIETEMCVDNPCSHMDITLNSQGQLVTKGLSFCLANDAVTS